MAGSTQGLLENLLGLAGDLSGGALRVSVKTNLGPELDAGEVALGGGAGASSGASQGGFSGLLGIKAAVILRDARGRIVAMVGDPPPTEPVKVALLLALALAAVVLIVRGLRR